MTLGRKTVYTFMMLPWHTRIDLLMKVGFRPFKMDEDDIQYYSEGFKYATDNNQLTELMNLIHLTELSNSVKEKG